MACKRLRFMADTCRAVLKAAGCGPLRQEVGSYDAFACTHVFGTCRSGGGEAHFQAPVGVNRLH